MIKYLNNVYITYFQGDVENNICMFRHDIARAGCTYL